MADQQLTLKIDGDGSGAVASVNDVVSALQSAVDSTAGFVADLQASVADSLSVLAEANAGLGDQLVLPFDTMAQGAEQAAEETKSSVLGMFDELLAGAIAEVATMGDSIKDLGDKIETGFSDPIGAAKDVAKDFLEELGPLGVGLTALGAAISAAGAGLFELAKSSAETGESILNFSLITGTSVDQIGQLSATATLAGSSLEGMQSMLTQMTRRLDATGPAADKMNAALQDLKINVDEFRDADPNDRIAMLADGMQAAAGSTNLMSDALAIMGRAGVQNIPALMKMTEDLRAKGAELGQQWSNDDVNAAKELSEETAATGVIFKTLADTIGTALTPATTELVAGFNRTILALEHIADLGGLVSGTWGLMKGAAGEYALEEQTSASVTESVNKLWADQAKAGVDLHDATYKVADQMLTMGYNEKTVAEQTGLAITEVQLLKKELNDNALDSDGFTKKQLTQIQNLKAAIEGESASYQVQTKVIQDEIAADSLDADGKQRLVDAIEKLKKGHQELTPEMQAFLVTNQALTPEYQKQQKAIDAVVQSLDGDSKATQTQVAALDKVIKAGVDDEDQKQRVLDLITKLEDKNIMLTQTIYDWDDANRVLLASTNTSATSLDLYNATVDEANRRGVSFTDQQTAMKGVVYGFGITVGDIHPVMTQAIADSYNLDSSTNEVHSGMDQFGDTLNSVTIPAITNLATGVVPQATQALKDATLGTNEWSTALDKAFANLPNAMEKAFEGSGGLDGAIKSFGVTFGKNVGSMIESPEGPLASMLPESMDNVFGAALGGLAGGGVGSLISIGVNKLASWIGSLFSKNIPADIENIGTTYGLTITSQMQKTIQDTMSSLHLTEQAATIFNASQLFPTVDVNNFNDALKMTHDAFSMIQTGQLSVAQGGQVVNDMWTKLVAVGTDATGLLNQSLQDMVKLNEQFGTNSAAIASYQQQQMTSAATSIGASIKVTADALSTYDQLNEKQMALAASGAQMNTVTWQGVQYQSALTQAEFTQMNTAGVLYDTTRVKSQQAAEAIGTTLVGAIDAELQSGKSMLQAITDNATAINGFQSELTATGFSGGAAFDFIQKEASLVTDQIAGPAIQAIDGYAQGMVGLANAGQLNQTTFAGLTEQIGDTESALKSQGYSESDVMAATQKDLQTVWELEQQYGYKADDTTQKLIDQAQQAGLVGEAQKSTGQQTVDALNKVVDKLDQLLQGLGIQMPDALNNLVGTAQNVAGQVTDSLNSIPREIDFTMNGTVNVPDLNNIGGAQTSPIPSFDARPMEAVTSAGYALLHPGDMVGVPQPGMLGGSASALAHLSAVSNGIDTLNDSINGLPDIFARKVRDAVQMASL